VGRLERDFYLFKEGEWLRQDLLQETERVLYDTNAFNTVTITSEPSGEFANGVEERDVTVDVAEARPYLLIYGFGFQTSQSDRNVPGLGFLNGARGLVQLTNVNLFGKLYTGSAQMRVSQDELLGQLSFQNPRPFGKNYPMLISLFARRLAEVSFNSDRYTAIIQFERRLSPETIAYVSYNFERISNYNFPEGFIPEEIERNRQAVRLGRLGLSIARDSRDNAFEPTTGQLSLGSVSLASKLLGGNEQFGKILLEHSRYYPIRRFRDTVYSVSGRLGLASPYGGADTLPISERFFAGGPRDLRGFGFEEAGPRGDIVDPTTGAVIDTQPLGGNAVLVINNELRFPIYGILGGTLFADTGNVFRRVRDFRIQDLTQTIGFGLRLKTPIGPVRFDLAFLVLNRPEGQPSFRRHFTFGQTF
ncbi:MAG TPA: outer membrane protein assembly factor, partial [Blastocatellia bacterium]|nr:outer membrane protein assembly factor [Blastocatellia bacterium]